MGLEETGNEGNKVPSDSDWRDWIALCDITKCRPSAQTRLRGFAAAVGIGLHSKRRDLGFLLLDSRENQSERFWSIFEIHIQAGAVLQREEEPPSGLTWSSLQDRRKVYKNSLGQAKRGLSHYAASIMTSAFLFFASGESCRRIRRDGKLRMLHGKPLDFVSLDAPCLGNEGATLLETLSDSDKNIPGVAAVCSLAEENVFPDKLPAEILAPASAWAESQFKSLCEEKKKSNLVAIAAVAMGISPNNSRVRAAAGVAGKGSVVSARIYFKQNLLRSPVLAGMNEDLHPLFMQIALGRLSHLCVRWATENHVFAPEILPSPPTS